MQPRQTSDLASWLETILWYHANPGRAGEGEAWIDAFGALYDHDPEAARRANPDLAAAMAYARG